MIFSNNRSNIQLLKWCRGKTEFKGFNKSIQQNKFSKNNKGFNKSKTKVEKEHLR